MGSQGGHGGRSASELPSGFRPVKAPDGQPQPLHTTSARAASHPANNTRTAPFESSAAGVQGGVWWCGRQWGRLGKKKTACRPLLYRLDKNPMPRGLTNDQSIPLVLTVFSCSTDVHSSVQWPLPAPGVPICVSRWLWVPARRKKAAPCPPAGPWGSRVPVGSSQARCYSSLT